MVSLFRTENWKITVYGREHGVPHFHVEGPGFRCSISIETHGLIIGTAPAAVLKSARAWARGHHAELMATWRELNE
jgi:hypothetical protein